MDRRYTTALSAVFYSICAVACGGLAGCALTIISFPHPVKPLLSVVVVLSGFAGSFFYCLGIKSAERRYRHMSATLALLLLFYSVLLLDLMLVDDGFGRNIFNIFNWNETDFGHYLETATNLVPFATIRLFINGYAHGAVTLSACLENILGNLLVFMPFSLLIPAVFTRINRWYKLFGVILVSVMTVELLQLVFLTGSSDIDDVILNVSGAMSFYALIHTSGVEKALEKITFGVLKRV